MLSTYSNENKHIYHDAGGMESSRVKSKLSTMPSNRTVKTDPKQEERKSSKKKGRRKETCRIAKNNRKRKSNLPRKTSFGLQPIQNCSPPTINFESRFSLSNELQPTGFSSKQSKVRRRRISNIYAACETSNKKSSLQMPLSTLPANEDLAVHQIYRRVTDPSRIDSDNRKLGMKNSPRNAGKPQESNSKGPHEQNKFNVDTSRRSPWCTIPKEKRSAKTPRLAFHNTSLWVSILS